jgi:hypothetical protein
MAAGRAVVSSAIGGTDELIEDGRSGLLVPPGDSAALAAALRRVLADSKLRESFAARARERIDQDLTRESMARRVTGVYAELLGEVVSQSSAEEAERLPESRRNPLLRRLDWRFLLPGGHLARSWRLPRIAGPRRARQRLEAEGFSDVRVYWAGPLPHRLPQFWLPVESPQAVDYLLASRRPASAPGRAVRAIWRLVNRAGLLAPLHVVARAPGEARTDDLSLCRSAPLLLLTGGHRSINKAVGLAFEDGAEKPIAAVKFARVAEAEPGLAHEAEVLRRLGEERPGLAGIPRLRGQGRRAGRLAVAEEAIEGVSLLDVLNGENFEEMALRVTRVLIELAEGGGVPAPDWRQRLVEEPLAWFEQSLRGAISPEALATARTRLEGVGDLPPACEHRDCSPWNVIVDPAGDPVLLDWESAEPDGLPGMDLVYFLANCAFVLDHSIENGRTRESYARLLDPATPFGRIAVAAFDEYASALNIHPADFARIRLLCWVVHSRSDYRHLQLESPGAPPPPQALREAMFVGLVEEELKRDQAR